MNKYDFYDHTKAEELRDQHCKKRMDLFKRLHNAREKGNQKAMESARKALAKHKEKGEQYKQWADEAGFYWYP